MPARALLAALALLVSACGDRPAPAAAPWTPAAASTAPPLTATAVPEQAYDRTPVLIVHGHGSASTDFDAMVDDLERRYPPAYVHAVDIVPANTPNETAAEEFIAPAVEVLLATAAVARGDRPGPAPAKVDVVAHSMGAVSSRLYAARMRPDRVGTWVSIAGANHGTNAACRFDDATAFELCPAFSGDAARQPLQVELNGTPDAPVDESPFGAGPDRPGVPSVPPTADRAITYFTVRLPTDELITPPETAELDGAGGRAVTVPDGVRASETSPGNFLFEEPTDHGAIIDDPKMHELLAVLLDGG